MKFLLAVSLLAGPASAGNLGRSLTKPVSSLSMPKVVVDKGPHLAMVNASKLQRRSANRKLSEGGSSCVGGESAQMALLNLPNPPYINGELDAGEYDDFTSLPMFNGGKNEQGTAPIAMGEIAYDCNTKKLCAATYYTSCYLDFSCDGGLDESAPAPLDESDGNSWLELTGYSKFKQSNSDSFNYIYTEVGDNDEFAMGWEGCWTVGGDGLDGTMNIQLHFNRDSGGGQTTSTGKDVGAGSLLNICVNCDSEPPCVDTSDPHQYPPMQCKTYDCDGNLVTDPGMDGMDCDVASECYSGTCMMGTCMEDPLPNESPCGPSDLQVCCVGVCKDSCDTDPVCDETTCGSTPPTLSAPASPDGEVFQGCALPQPDDRTATYCIADPSIVAPMVQGPANDEICGDYIVTYKTPEDCLERSIEDVLTYTLTNDDPVLSVPDDLTLECDEESDADTIGVPSATDDCDAATDIIISAPSDSETGTACHKSITRTYSATDSCGNTVEESYEILIEDTTPPVIYAPEPYIGECDGGFASTPIDTSITGSAKATDNCQVPSISNSLSHPTSDDSNCYVEFTRTFEASDGCSNTATAAQLIRIEDNTNPEFTSTPDDKVYQCNADLDLSATEAGAGLATGEDSCTEAAVTIADGPTSGNACHETFERTFTLSDACGNSVTAHQTIEVQDTEAPTLVAPGSLSVECASHLDTSSGNTGTPQVEDSCPSSTFLVSESDVTIPYENCEDMTWRVIERTWSATDSCGNTQEEVQTITVKDTMSPTLHTPGTTTVECSADHDLSSSSTGTATAYDSCPLSTVTVAESDSSSGTGTCDENKVYETITRTWTATDSCANIAEGDQVIFLKDETAPKVGAPGDLTLECVAGQDTSPATTGTSDPSDSCPLSSVSSDSSDSVDTPAVCVDGVKQTIHRTWTAVDSCLNSASETQKITVSDTNGPLMANGPEDKQYLCSDPCNSADGAPPASTECAGVKPAANDACDGPVDVEISDVSVATSTPPGVKYTRTFTATDECGNESTETQMISVVDDCNFDVSDAFSGLSINVDVTVLNVDAGIQITVAVDDDTLIGDFRGVFFEVTDADAITDIYEVSSWIADNDGVDRVSNDVVMKGGGKNMPTYNVGVEIGSMGKSFDDYQSYTFTVAGVTTDDISDTSYFGIRLTSVGEEHSDREESSKIYGPVTCCRA